MFHKDYDLENRDDFPFTKERDQAGAGMDGGYRKRRPSYQFHRPAVNQFDTLFR
jgi:hypothetical protein